MRKTIAALTIGAAFIPAAPAAAAGTTRGAERAAGRAYYSYVATCHRYSPRRWQCQVQTWQDVSLGHGYYSGRCTVRYIGGRYYVRKG